MTDSDLELMLDKAAERGAKRALQSVGLHDDGAGTDIHELRGLLDSWRDAKRTALQTFVKAAATAMLGALVLGAWMQFTNSK